MCVCVCPERVISGRRGRLWLGSSGSGIEGVLETIFPLLGTALGRAGLWVDLEEEKPGPWETQ